MNLGRKGKGAKYTPSVGVNRPGANLNKKWMLLGVIVATAVAGIMWVTTLGKKAEETVEVVMLNQNIYKNDQVTEKMLKPYNMLVGEYEKYSIVDDNGTEKRRVVLWEERNKIINTFAAYPLQANTVGMYRDFVKSRVDNSDAVLYSFPGKVIVPLQIGTSELEAFKTFLKPGDALVVKADYVEKKREQETDAYGNKVQVEYELFKTEDVFNNIMVADLLNNKGESVLDIYTKYNDMPVWQQAQLDKSSEFQDSTIPKTLLVALTPEESDRYSYFLTKSQVKFRAELPQRVDR